MAVHKRSFEFDYTITCRVCGSTDLSKYGKYKETQYYICKDCGAKSSEFFSYPRMKYPKNMIDDSMIYYYNGMSFQNISQTFNDKMEVDIPKSTFWRWVIKYTDITTPYVKSNKPTNIGDKWVADETMIKSRGKKKWLWAIIDKRTRYLLACNFTTVRTIKEATKLFYDAYYFAGKKPLVIYTDKMKAYLRAFNRVFYSRYSEDRAHHFQSKGFESKTNINLIERWHEYIKQRTKIMRYLKNDDSAFTILQGIITHYNYFWEHSSIGGITPAEKAGIDIQGMDLKNWGDLIGLALLYQQGTPNPKEYTFWLDERERIGQ